MTEKPTSPRTERIAEIVAEFNEDRDQTDDRVAVENLARALARAEAAAATPSLDSRLRDFVSAYFDTVDGDGTPAEVYTAEQDMRKAWERAVNPALARLDEGSATPDQGKGEPR